MNRTVVNFVAFQIAWFACVLGGAHGLPWAGVAVTALAVAVHLVLAPGPGREALLILAVAAIGALWDGALAGLGVLVFPSGTLLPWLAPVWIVAMWAGFATTLNVSLRWLAGRSRLAMAFGALGGPLAYYAGMKLGGVSFPHPVAALAALSAGWAVLMPLMVWMAGKLAADRPRPERAPGATQLDPAAAPVADT